MSKESNIIQYAPFFALMIKKLIDIPVIFKCISQYINLTPSFQISGFMLIIFIITCIFIFKLS